MFVELVLGSSRLHRFFNGPLAIQQVLDEIKLENDNKASFFVLSNGRKVDEHSLLEDGKVYHIVPRLLGGKGGFGSMLRAIGAQIEKTTSREACRDLSGRRMRDINNEKKLKEWLAKEADREREREQRRQERLAKHLAPPKHKFDDQEYREQQAKVQEDLEDALNKGLKRAHQKDDNEASSSKKMKSAPRAGSSKAEWLGMDIDSDDLNSDSDNEACPGNPDSNSQSEKSDGERTQPETPSDTDGNSRSSDCRSASPHVISDVKEEDENKMEGSPTTSAHTTSNRDHVSSNCHVKEEKNKMFGASQKHEKSGHGLLSTLPHPSNTSSDVAVKSECVSSDEPVDLDSYSSSEELCKLGLERLKNALMSRGLKCGGTLEERAERLFSVKGLSADEIDPSLFAKLKGKGKKSK